MTTFNFSSLNNGQVINFKPAVDILNFGTAGSASALRVVQGADLKLTLGAKSVLLDGVALGELSLESLTFANGSLLAAGDGTLSTLADWYGQFYDASAETVGSSFWGLGGADVVEGGNGADYIVGNTPYTPINQVSRNGATGAPTATSYPTISADGNLVAFYGGWTEFGSQSNSGTDVFVKNMSSGAFSNEHKSETGEFGRSGSGRPVISADGEWLAFWSASALVQGATTSLIYMSGTTSGDVLAVSLDENGNQPDRPVDYPDVSGNGLWVVFQTWATNFGPGALGNWDIYLKNMSSGELVRASTSTSNGGGNGDSQYARVSMDGRLVAYQSAASNLTAGDTNGDIDIFVYDNSDGSLYNITGDLPGRNFSDFLNPDIAWDDTLGGTVVFETGTALVDADDNNFTDIYAVNLADSSVQLVSSRDDGTSLGGSSTEASISGDGRFVAFRAFSDGLPEDTNGYSDIYVKDLFTGSVALVSRAPNGAGGNQYSSDPQISLGGDWIVFESGATNFASTDGNAGFGDVFRVSNPLLFDVLRGGGGNDTYVIARATDVIEELANGGTDLVQASISYTLGANVENLTLTGSNNLAGKGNSLNNVITGNGGNNVLDGGAGKDTASYATAAKAVTVSLAVTAAQATGAGNDKLSNFENLTGSGYADKLTGNTAVNRLDGGAGNDTLAGGGGADVLVGGAGADRLSGGDGADVFRFDSKTGFDTVTDFLSGTDDLVFAFGIGDGDATVESGVVRGAAGGFTPGAELVIFTQNLAALTPAAAAAGIGSASSAYTVGAKRLFAVDNGTDSAIFLFTSADANAAVSAAELTQVALLSGDPLTALGDYLFAG